MGFMANAPRISRFSANPLDWTPSGNAGFPAGRPPRPPWPGRPPMPGGATWPNPAGLIYRSFEGSGNHLTNSGLNASGADFSRLGSAYFGDGVSALRTDLPNPRTVSNLVVDGDGDRPNPEGLSAMMYAWGQFIDHDINLTLSDDVNHIDIVIPPGDAVLSGSISMTRAVIDPLTGIAGQPAITTNNVTGWIDASMVYGSDSDTAASLRASDGHLLTSSGNNLPIVDGAFLAGDIRVQENPDLTALQTLFVREHNRKVDALALSHPGWSGDQLYDQARAIVTAEIERITYREFLPHLLGAQTPAAYRGYSAAVDPRLSEEFAGAAFRFGHSIVSANLEKVDEHGNLLGAAVSLKDAFFQDPADFVANDGADGLLRHLGSDLSNALDVHLVDDLRNFLFGPSAGMDLAAINLQRGRDLGLGTLNETRLALGLKPYNSFKQISSDPEVRASLKAAYGSVDLVELWIGGLAEDHLPRAMVGQTFAFIIANQFENLRAGDRLWYQNQGFDPATLAQIESTTLSSLILDNTSTQFIQDDAFVYYERRAGQREGGDMQDSLAPQLVVGSTTGPDTLIGGRKDDLLVAGAGRQVLTGGLGADTFVFTQQGARAVIRDFKPGIDMLRFAESAQVGGLGPSLTQEHGSVTVLLGEDRISLPGVRMQDLRHINIQIA